MLMRHPSKILGLCDFQPDDGHSNPQRISLTGLRYLTARTLANMLVFPPDMARASVAVNWLDGDQALVHYFDEEWADYGAH